MFGKKASKARLELEKERLELRLKKQEFEIKKTLLDLKAQYHPMSIMANAASDFMNRAADEEESKLQAFSASVSNAFKERKKESNSPVVLFKSLIYNLFILMASFFDSLSLQFQEKGEVKQEAPLDQTIHTPISNPTPNPTSAPTPPPQQEKNDPPPNTNIKD